MKLALLVTMFLASAVASVRGGMYQDAHVKNLTPYQVTGTVDYDGAAVCNSNTFSIEANSSWTWGGGRGICLINKVAAQVILSDKSIIECEFDSSGTGESDFLVSMIDSNHCAVTLMSNRRDLGMYQPANVDNTTPYDVAGYVKYDSVFCSETNFAIDPNSSWTWDGSRGICLINTVAAQVMLPDNTILDCTPWTSSGTGYSDFLVSMIDGSHCEVSWNDNRRARGLRGSTLKNNKKVET